MNISVMVTYFKYLLLAGAMCAFASCQREDLPSEQEGKAIELSASSEWPKISKAPIAAPVDLKDDGFVVWGYWKQDITSASSKEDAAVFETNGTRVSAGANTTNWTNLKWADLSWTYSPVRYWFSGNYIFAALLPASAISVNTANTNGILAVQNRASSSLVLDREYALGGKSVDGTELAAGAQVDLMYAFSEVDNTEHKDAIVNLNFKHLWAQVGFKLTYQDIKLESITVTQVKVYGMGNTIDFNADVTISDNETSNMSAIRRALSDAVKSTSANPFATFNMNATANRGVQITLADKLMVFPVNLAETPVTVEISFKYGNNDMSMKGTINAGEWVSGKRYVYPLEVGANSINFSEPTVTDWVKGESIRIDIDKDND